MQTAEIDIASLIPPASKLLGKEKLLSQVIAFIKENPGVHTPKLCGQMKSLGMKRPEWIPKENWNPMRRLLNNQGSLICRMAAFGMKSNQIADQLKMSEQTVKDYLKDPEMVKQVITLQESIFGGNPRELFRSALVEAFQTELTIMRDEGQKGSTRLSAAQDLMDRAAGKAPQEINLNDSNMRNLIDRLDKIERLGGLKAIEVKSEITLDKTEVKPEASEQGGEVIDLQSDSVDSWLKENGF